MRSQREASESSYHKNILKACNPLNLSYLICICYPDFIIQDDLIICMETLFCFRTSYPFIEFFLKLAASLISKRKQLTLSQGSVDQTDLSFAIVSKLPVLL